MRKVFSEFLRFLVHSCRNDPNALLFFLIERDVKSYDEAEDNAIKISYDFWLAVIGSSMLINIPALFRTLYKTFIENGNLEENYVLPIVCSLPFTVNTWPKFTLAFLWTMSSICCIAATKVFTTSVFFSMCFHIIALLQHLQMMVADFNDIK